jgi:hypothetical protein
MVSIGIGEAGLCALLERNYIGFLLFGVKEVFRYFIKKFIFDSPFKSFDKTYRRFETV